ncbi:TPA: hypothetical protein ACN34R_003450 [Vibrio parahaemolyticus]|nr:hypothetical protein [Vibrio parahaemolyticus]EKZ9250961.1 hypothetical protein [Vibrio parahaemolyticus]ELA6679831.1 hypothetical protein [Vibrio parahaemolyticus]ELI6472727.1 hypothetical protein [Vibrio parahaemolyticus]
MTNNSLPPEETENQDLNGIFEVPANRRYWLVRSDSGKYFDHFTMYNVIALGHLDKLKLDECDVNEFILDSDDLRDRYMKLIDQKNKKAKTKAYSQINQAIRFIYEMEVGDWVITVGKIGIRYGVITSSPYIRTEPLVVDYQNGDYEVKMTKHLRRNVNWGPIIRRRNLPYGLSQALRARQTVTSLDEHWQALHHSIFPAFKANGNLYLSIKIRSEQAISNYSVMSLLKLMNEIEIIGKEFNSDFDINNFEEIFDEYLENDKLTVTTKAQFNSPGDIWTVMSSAVEQYSWIAPTFVAYSMLFGNKLMGIDGILDLDTRHKIRDAILERIKVNKADKQLEKLELHMPKANTEILEVPAERKIDVDS